MDTYKYTCNYTQLYVLIIRVNIQSHKIFDTYNFMSISTSVYLQLLVFII